jgi:hypothetical protein
MIRFSNHRRSDEYATPEVRCRAFPRSTIELSNPQTALNSKWCMISCEIRTRFYDSIMLRLRSVHESMSQIKESSRSGMQWSIQNLIVPFLPRTITRRAVMDVFSRHSLVPTNVLGYDDICELAGNEVTGAQLLLTQIDIISYSNNIFGNIVYELVALPNFDKFGIHYGKALVKIAEELIVQPPDNLLMSIHK